MSEEIPEDDELTVPVEYTPMELVTGLQLLDYIDIMFLGEGMPLGIVGIHREKLLKALLKDDIYDEIKMEREKRTEEFQNMFSPPETKDKGTGFQ